MLLLLYIIFNNLEVNQIEFILILKKTLITILKNLE